MKDCGTKRENSAGRGTREVDLHLRSGYSGPDAVERQLARFRGELESAVRRGDRDIIFIHGQGTGRLREEIRQILTHDYPSFLFHDAPFSRYGYGGATLVTIKK
jgi:dsDNA-specific endonuclease/ATPase MutS2